MVSTDIHTDATRVSRPSIDSPVMRQSWNDVTFAHWAIDPERIARILPYGVQPDTFEGSAWISLVGFEMRDLRVRSLPPIPTTARFAEFNVRTYVTGSAGPGVWFFSLDVPHWLPAITARTTFALPYCHARIDSYRGEGISAWSVERDWPDRRHGRLSVEIEAGANKPNELDRFLTDRWRLYARMPFSRRLLTAPVEHDPWKLEPTRIREVGGDLMDALVGRVDGDPRSHFARRVDVKVGRPRWA